MTQTKELSLSDWLAVSKPKCVVIDTDSNFTIPPKGTIVKVVGFTHYRYTTCANAEVGNQTYTIPIKSLSPFMDEEHLKVLGTLVPNKKIKVGTKKEEKEVEPSLREKITPIIQLHSSHLVLNQPSMLLLGLSDKTGINFFVEEVGPNTGDLYVAVVPAEMKAHHMPVNEGVCKINDFLYSKLNAIAGPGVKGDKFLSFEFWNKCSSDQYPDIPMYRVIPGFYKDYGYVTSKNWAQQYRSAAIEMKEALEKYLNIPSRSRDVTVSRRTTGVIPEWRIEEEE